MKAKKVIPKGKGTKNLSFIQKIMCCFHKTKSSSKGNKNESRVFNEFIKDNKKRPSLRALELGLSNIESDKNTCDEINRHFGNKIKEKPKGPDDRFSGQSLIEPNSSLTNKTQNHIIKKIVKFSTPYTNDSNQNKKGLQRRDPRFSPVEVQNEFDRIRDNSFKNLDTIKSNNSKENKLDSDANCEHPEYRGSSKSCVVHYLNSDSDGIGNIKKSKPKIDHRVESCSISDSVSDE